MAVTVSLCAFLSLKVAIYHFPGYIETNSFPLSFHFRQSGLVLAFDHHVGRLFARFFTGLYSWDALEQRMKTESSHVNLQFHLFHLQILGTSNVS